MSKRKRDIKKRKKLQEETRENEDLLADDPVEQDEPPEEEIAMPVEGDPEELPPAESPIDDSQIVTATAQQAVKKPVPKKKVQDPPSGTAAVEGSWFGQNKENLLLGLLILYVLLLGLGTAGELFEIEWILNLPLFR